MKKDGGQPNRRSNMARDPDTASPVQVLSSLAFADTLGQLSHVRKVFALQNGCIVSVWTVVDSFDREVRDRIYAVERNLFSDFPGIQFDFNVIEGDETTTIPEAKLVYSTVQVT